MRTSNCSVLKMFGDDSLERSDTASTNYETFKKMSKIVLMSEEFKHLDDEEKNELLTNIDRISVMMGLMVTMTGAIAMEEKGIPLEKYPEFILQPFNKLNSFKANITASVGKRFAIRER